MNDLMFGGQNLYMSVMIALAREGNVATAETFYNGSRCIRIDKKYGIPNCLVVTNKSIFSLFFL